MRRRMIVLLAAAVLAAGSGTAVTAQETQLGEAAGKAQSVVSGEVEQGMSAAESAVKAMQEMSAAESAAEAAPGKLLEKDEILAVLERVGLPATVEEEAIQESHVDAARFNLYDPELTWEESGEAVQIGTISEVIDGDEFGISAVFISTPDTPADAEFSWEDWRKQIDAAALLCGKLEEGELFELLSDQTVLDNFSTQTWEMERPEGYWFVRATAKMAGISGSSENTDGSGGFVLWLTYASSRDFYRTITGGDETDSSLEELADSFDDRPTEMNGLPQM